MGNTGRTSAADDGAGPARPALAALLRGWRQRALLTQDQLAERTGLSVRTIRRLEAGHIGRPYSGSIQLLVGALDLTDAERGLLVATARGEPPLPGRTTGTVPRQLPADIAGFAGRAEQLRRLDALLVGDGKPGPVVISALSGTAGVGKTALAVHWAHRVADRFGDGQLYLNLRGFDPHRPPTAPADAIRQLLDAFAVPPEQLPASLDGQAALYRSLLADRRVLVLLDNARDAEQVRLLLPGAPTCLAVVTSRSELSGLVAIEGAQPLELDLLTAAEAAELLARRLGADRVAAEPAAVDEIVARCARLPLALAVVAGRAATRPDFSLAALAAELRDAGGLTGFAGADPAADVQAVLSWSYRRLSAGAARLFRLLGLHRGPDIATPAAASLAGEPIGQVRPLLTELVHAHLLTEPRPGRYACHDLLRVYAAELADRVDPDTDRQAAAHRVLDHYLHTAHPANRLLAARTDPVAPPPPRPGVVPEVLGDDERAMAWFTAEHAVLLSAIGQAADAGLQAHTWQLARALTQYLARRGHWRDLVATQSAALDAAESLADLTAQAHAHGGLAGGCTRLGDHDRALGHYQRALEEFAAAGDRRGQAASHRNLAHVLEQQGRLPEALDHAQQALDLLRVDGGLADHGDALNSVGWLHAHLGDCRQALACCEQAVALHEEAGDRAGAAAAWDSLGYTQHRLGEHGQAAACYRRALDLFASLGDRFNEADILTHLGDAEHAAGDADAARRAWRRALATLDELAHADAGAVRARLDALDRPLVGNATPARRAGRT